MTTALIIEDNDDNMALISFILQKGGYDLIEARTGEEGVDLALQHKPDLIILDIQLPGIDGFEVLRRIRTSESNGSIPIIAMTSYAMTGDRERLLAAGCNGYIEKPIDPAKVMDQIRAVIGKKA
ncbi:MAG: response regulator [Zetaproteobacteria bacterium CG12_big_fil_rev_8_21_14_0_65_55_1124]|nr:MAG: two-component system response regulator [Zetaproteobacteria bacterium CG1_02_55_237]PIS19688.1 MAG: response regulator [Zetaproteobacteria bacterium CG08_land_8_20_14_0_20_55_17]PIW42793.1 MAG: response regulator [Zetaproteobacteria bacterium CG12_big_fil_rev_8_21_14_0_65_55_1124]PIY54003.1 MAG: response regulator [Zetaproteobacteria bacterium CG_4_10_14_0_8_um_filter_55_43]PIZ39597.1 MAG: response regulator [Zetaproteobacteria bacterium CG_4_10_14_0_2_um_filter_55_20]PJB79030.1 MAG: r